MPDLTETLGRAGVSISEALAGEDDLGHVAVALAREVALREVMAGTGESREVVEEAIGAMGAMAEEAVLDLTEGNPTTLWDALSRYVDGLNARLTDDPNDEELGRGAPIGGVLSDLYTLLNYPWPAGMRGPYVALEDSLERQAMRYHAFVGEGQYCEAMLPMGSGGTPETGIITMTAGCGYGRDTHPEVVTDGS